MTDAARITAAARELYQARRSRKQYFETLGCAFGEPMWDLMLELFVAQREQRRVSLSKACISANVPVTTAMRWLALMESEAILVREADPTDKRRAFVRLHETAARAMERYISDIVLGDDAGYPCADPPSTKASA